MSNGQNVQKVQLGCGTLILIALIVMIFSAHGHDADNVGALQSDLQNLQTEVRQLRGDLLDLKQAVKKQTDQIESLRKTVEATSSQK